MATLRLLLALLLMAVGTTFGALAISGYYEPHMTHGQLVTAPNTPPQPVEKPRLNLWLPKHGFAGTADGPAAKPPAKPKVAIKAAPDKPKPPAQALPRVKDKQPQAAAASQWPWNLFGI